ncbi:MAG: pyruvate formate lyase family protein, partial [Clostridia bacterium]|nr:pyruvate formate lyase family protein [Clostridia bacterium]
MQRIKSLRQEPLVAHFTYNEFYCRFFKSYLSLEDLPEYERYAESAYAAFSSVTPAISPGELILGKRITAAAMSPELRAEWEQLRPQAEARMNRCGGGQDSHMAIDYEKLLSVGIEGIIAEIDGYLTLCTEEKKPFYRAARRCLEGVLVHADAYADACVRLSESETDPVRREELSGLAAICRRVPRYPAETFHEAVQSVHFISHCLTWDPFRLCPQQFQLGHPDHYLAPYYEADLAAGRITRERAQLLLCCLGIQINNRVPNGLSSGFMVGGRDKKGNTVANELTEMCLQVISDIRLVYPAVGLCYTEDMPRHILDKVISLLLAGHSHPAIFNDDVITRGLLSYGVPQEEASDYIHSTCVE